MYANHIASAASSGFGIESSLNIIFIAFCSCNFLA